MHGRRGGRGPLRIHLLILLGSLSLAHQATAGVTGHLLIVGQGPEQPVVQDLARAFEKGHPGTAIDLEWDRNLKAVEMVKTSQAQIAVTGLPDQTLAATQVAWDGIAVVVNFTNPIKEVTSAQVAALLSGEIVRWSELDGANTKVEVIQRPSDRNLTAALEQSLGLPSLLKGSAKIIRSDLSALSEVSGKDGAVTYLSLATALKAQEDGAPIQVLTIDRVEPGEPTVKNGRYKLRRPVLFLTSTQRDSLTEAFLAFARSPEGQHIIRSMFAPMIPGSI
ncbi:MAG: substrate-binding domain-containing protein [Nitrospirae bacterium]|nr:substrate-binding domain-containing protein [Nitrospirota bacterium]